MIKRIALALLATISFLASNAQSILYSPYETNPDLFSRSMLTLSIFELTAGRDYGLSQTAKFETMVGTKVAPFISYTWNVVTEGSSTGVSQTFHMNEPEKNPSRFELGATYYFLDQNINDFINVDVGQTIKTEFGSKSSQAIPGQVKHLLGVDFGFIKTVELNVTEYSNDLKFYNTTAKNIIDPNNPNSYSYPPFFQYSSISLMAGLRYKFVNRTIIKTDDGLKHRNAKMFTAYLDLIYAPSFSINNYFVNISDSSAAKPGVYVLTIPTKDINNFGFRLGGTKTTSNRFGAMFNFEVGVVPGYYVSNSIFGRGGYFKTGIGIGIGSNKHFKLPGEATPEKISNQKTKKSDPEIKTGDNKQNNI